MGPHLLHLKPGEQLYEEVATRFREGWKHPNKTASITDIFYIVYEGSEAQTHLANNRNYLQIVNSRTGGHAESYLFHGTQRACFIGETATNTNPCNNTNCHVCSIIKCSFQISHIGQNNAFGPGFYTSPVSSKADGYSKNFHMHSHKHAMFLGNVITGRKEIVYHFDHNKRPADGFDSVEAATTAAGGAVAYTENIVYQEKAILPSIVVMYTRTGWTPSG